MRCNEFWDKWEKEPNFCGLSAQSISEIKGYLELRDKVVKMGIQKTAFYENCPSGACRPVLRLSDDETRTDATNYIIACLKRGEKVTQGDLKGFVDMRLKKDAVCKVPSKHEDERTQMRRVEKPQQPMEKPILSLGQQARAQETRPAEPEQHVHPGAICTVNPIVINDSYRESPFRTAAQIKAGISEVPIPESNLLEKPDSSIPAKSDKELFMVACSEAYEHGKPDFRQAVDDLMRYHPSWKDPGTVIYFCVTDPKEAIGGRK